MQKYWLNIEEYHSLWKPIEDKIFYIDKIFPELVFRPKFKILPLQGGSLFAQEDFEVFQSAINEMGDKYFFIVQRSQDFEEGKPIFRMKFPSSISWGELISGNYISAILLEMNYNEYCVFGESGKWGKYSANDYDYPFDLIGFDPGLTTIFKKHFTPSSCDKEEIYKYLPKAYKDAICGALDI